MGGGRGREEGGVERKEKEAEKRGWGEREEGGVGREKEKGEEEKWEDKETKEE